jgi:hypothetical protein
MVLDRTTKFMRVQTQGLRGLLSKESFHLRRTNMDGNAHKPDGYSRRRMLLLSQSILALGVPTTLLGIGSAAAATGDQNAWRFCNKCESMFYDGYPNKGLCPAGGGHAAQGYDFILHYDDNRGRPQTQFDWRFCNKCHAMFWDGDRANKGRCQAGGAHVAQGYMFGLHFTNETVRTPPAGANIQGSWRFCGKCMALFFDGYPSKGRCAAGGAHAALGWNFHLAYSGAAPGPQKIVSDVLQSVVNQNRGRLENAIKGQLGSGDLIRKGVTLYNINFRLGKPNFRFSTATNFDYRLNENYLYCKSTTPSVFGSYADPAFEIHFDLALTGALITPPGNKPHVEGVFASVPRVVVKPRNVSGGVVTTVVHFFQQTERGKEIIQRAADTHLRKDITDRINAQLTRV